MRTLDLAKITLRWSQGSARFQLALGFQSIFVCLLNEFEQNVPQTSSPKSMSKRSIK
jgi:hypothetical protein